MQVLEMCDVGHVVENPDRMVKVAQMVQPFPAHVVRIIPFGKVGQIEIGRLGLRIMPAEHNAVALLNGPAAHPRRRAARSVFSG